MFEEMRRQAPLCAMAVNWDFNEPWPCAAGNSLVAWPAEPKSCLKSVGEALRPTLLSLEIPRNRYFSGETVEASVWILNDCDEVAKERVADVYLISDGKKTKLCTVSVPSASARSNVKGEGFSFTVTEELPERFGISIECAERPEISSVYSLVHNKTK